MGDGVFGADGAGSAEQGRGSGVEAARLSPMPPPSSPPPPPTPPLPPSPPAGGAEGGEEGDGVGEGLVEEGGALPPPGPIGGHALPTADSDAGAESDDAGMAMARNVAEEEEEEAVTGTLSANGDALFPAETAAAHSEADVAFASSGVIDTVAQAGPSGAADSREEGITVLSAAAGRRAMPSDGHNDEGGGGSGSTGQGEEAFAALHTALSPGPAWLRDRLLRTAPLDPSSSGDGSVSMPLAALEALAWDARRREEEEEEEEKVRATAAEQRAAAQRLRAEVEEVRRAREEEATALRARADAAEAETARLRSVCEQAQEEARTVEERAVMLQHDPARTVRPSPAAASRAVAVDVCVAPVTVRGGNATAAAATAAASPRSGPSTREEALARQVAALRQDRDEAEVALGRLRAASSRHDVLVRQKLQSLLREEEERRRQEVAALEAAEGTEGASERESTGAHWAESGALVAAEGRGPGSASGHARGDSDAAWRRLRAACARAQSRERAAEAVAEALRGDVEGAQRAVEAVESEQRMLAWAMFRQAALFRRHLVALRATVATSVGLPAGRGTALRRPGDKGGGKGPLPHEDVEACRAVGVDVESPLFAVLSAVERAMETSLVPADRRAAALAASAERERAAWKVQAQEWARRAKRAEAEAAKLRGSVQQLQQDLVMWRSLQQGTSPSGAARLAQSGGSLLRRRSSERSLPGAKAPPALTAGGASPRASSSATAHRGAGSFPSARSLSGSAAAADHAAPPSVAPGLGEGEGDSGSLVTRLLSRFAEAGAGSEGPPLRWSAGLLEEGSAEEEGEEREEGSGAGHGHSVTGSMRFPDGWPEEEEAVAEAAREALRSASQWRLGAQGSGRESPAHESPKEGGIPALGASSPPPPPPPPPLDTEGCASGEARARKTAGAGARANADSEGDSGGGESEVHSAANPGGDQGS